MPSVTGSSSRIHGMTKCELILLLLSITGSQTEQERHVRRKGASRLRRLFGHFVERLWQEPTCRPETSSCPTSHEPQQRTTIPFVGRESQGQRCVAATLACLGNPAIG